MLRKPSIALLAGLACVAGLGVTLVLAYFAPPFGGRDAATLQGFLDLNGPRLTPLLSHVAHLADPAPYALIGLALVIMALVRRRGRVALAIAVVLIGSAVMTQTLQPLLAHARPPRPRRCWSARGPGPSPPGRCCPPRARGGGWAGVRSPPQPGPRATRPPRWRSRCAPSSPCRRAGARPRRRPAASSRWRSATRSSRWAGISRPT